MCRLILILSCTLLINSAWARNFRVAQLPNGTRYQCMNCHLNPVGGAVNIFGLDIMRTLNGDQANWSAVCALDSDSDGYSNGQELGDPNCTWMIGQASPNASILSNPADRFSIPVIREDMAIPMDMAIRDMMIVDAQIPIDQSIDVIDLFLVDAFVGDAFYSSGGRYEEDLALQSVDMARPVDMSQSADMSMSQVDLGRQVDLGGDQMDLGKMIDVGMDLGQNEMLLSDLQIQGEMGQKRDAMVSDLGNDEKDQNMPEMMQSKTQSGCQSVKLNDLGFLVILGMMMFLKIFTRKMRGEA